MCSTTSQRPVKHEGIWRKTSFYVNVEQFSMPCTETSDKLHTQECCKHAGPLQTWFTWVDLMPRCCVVLIWMNHLSRGNSVKQSIYKLSPICGALFQIFLHPKSPGLFAAKISPKKVQLGPVENIAVTLKAKRNCRNVNRFSKHMMYEALTSTEASALLWRQYSPSGSKQINVTCLTLIHENKHKCLTLILMSKSSFQLPFSPPFCCVLQDLVFWQEENYCHLNESTPHNDTHVLEILFTFSIHFNQNLTFDFPSSVFSPGMSFPSQNGYFFYAHSHFFYVLPFLFLLPFMWGWIWQRGRARPLEHKWISSSCTLSPLALKALRCDIASQMPCRAIT